MKTRMKILTLFALLFSMTVVAQEVNSNKGAASFKVAKNASEKVVLLTSDSTLVISDLNAVKLLKIGNRTYSVAALATDKAEVLFLTPEWIIQITELLETVPTGKSKSQVTQLQSPLIPYYTSYLKQAEQKKEVPK